MSDELRPIGPGRYAFTMTAPWGLEMPAELIIATVAGWPEREESRDPSWVLQHVGPVVLAIRLAGSSTVWTPARPDSSAEECVSWARLPASPVPGEWN